MHWALPPDRFRKTVRYLSGHRTKEPELAFGKDSRFKRKLLQNSLDRIRNRQSHLAPIARQITRTNAQMYRLYGVQPIGSVTRQHIRNAGRSAHAQKRREAALFETLMHCQLNSGDVEQ